MAQPAFSLSLSDIQHIARLARLELTDSEAAQKHAQLNHLFKFIAQMQAMDTSGIEPRAYPTEDCALRLRDDALTEFPERDAYQNCVPDVRDGLYRVPKVIE